MPHFFYEKIAWQVIRDKKQYRDCLFKTSKKREN